jgi:hypothetical protein
MSADFEGQAGARPAVQDLVKGKTYQPAAPYRRVADTERRPPANTGIGNRVLLWLADHEGGTATECAEALNERRDAVVGALNHLRSRGEIEYAETPSTPTSPRTYRVARRPMSPEQVQAVEQIMKAPERAPRPPPTEAEKEQAVAELLAMQTPPRRPPAPWEAPGVLALDTADWTWEQLLRAAQRLAGEALVRYDNAHPDPVRAALAGGVEGLARALRQPRPDPP